MTTAQVDTRTPAQIDWDNRYSGASPITTTVTTLTAPKMFTITEADLPATVSGTTVSRETRRISASTVLTQTEGRYGLIGATSSKTLWLGAKTSTSVNDFEHTAPPLTILEDGVAPVTVRASDDVPTSITLPTRYPSAPYAISDAYVFVADVEADSSDSSGYRNVITVYDAETGLVGAENSLRIRGSEGIVVAMYWANDALMVKMAPIDLEGNVGEPGDRWVAYKPNFDTLDLGEFTGTVIELEGVEPPDTASVDYVGTFTGEFYLLLNQAQSTIQGFDVLGNAVDPEPIQVTNTGGTISQIVFTEGDIVYGAVLNPPKVIAFRYPSGERVRELDFDYGDVGDIPLTAETFRGMTYDSTNKVIFIGHNITAYAYKVTDSLKTPEYTPELNISLDLELGEPSGIASFGDLVYVCHRDNNHIRAYGTDGVRIPIRDLQATAEGGEYAGLTLNGSTLLTVSSRDNTVYAWTLFTRTRRPSQDFQLFGLNNPEAIAFAGGKLYAAADIDGAERVNVYTVTRSQRVPRPRETTTERYKALAEEALGVALPAALDRGVDLVGNPIPARLLPARDVTEGVRDALRRCIDAEGGRAVDGVLYPRGVWRGDASDLTIDSVAVVVTDHELGLEFEDPPKTVVVDSLLWNQVTTADFQEDTYHALSETSAQRWGRRTRSVSTDASFQDAVALTNYYTQRRDEPFQALEVKLSLLHERDEDAWGALVYSRPHYPVYVEYTDEDGREISRPYLVLWSENNYASKGGEMVIKCKRILVNPRQFGIGWVLDGPSNLTEDVLSLETLLIDDDY